MIKIKMVMLATMVMMVTIKMMMVAAMQSWDESGVQRAAG